MKPDDKIDVDDRGDEVVITVDATGFGRGIADQLQATIDRITGGDSHE